MSKTARPLAVFLAALAAGCSPAAPSPALPAPGADARLATLSDRSSCPTISSAPASPVVAASPDARSVVPSADAGASPAARPLVKQAAGLVALQHVLLFDGTLAPPRPDQVVVIDHSKIVSLGSADAFVGRPEMTVIDLTGHAVMPGIVGMHDHLYYVARAGAPDDKPVLLLPEMFYSAPRLYLAGGVTTLRTTGSVEPYADLNLRRMIDEGATPGPELDVTAPYLQGPGGPFPQMAAVKSAAEARRFVAFWADQGATSIKAYMNVSREALRAGIEEAHRRKLKVTAHLCSVTYAEAAEMGIDNLEHGFITATDLMPGRKPDECPPVPARWAFLMLDPQSEPVQKIVKMLVARHVAITSTLPVFEQWLAGRTQAPRATALLEPILRERYLAARQKTDARPNPAFPAVWQNDLRLERAFVAAGGLLLAGADPTGIGGVLPGFGDQREIELLVEAGFSAVEAIHIATYNGAQYLGRLDRIGTIAPGKQADLVVVRGDPAARIQDVENVDLVFKNGVGYDPDALIDSVRGTVGLY